MCLAPPPTKFTTAWLCVPFLINSALNTSAYGSCMLFLSPMLVVQSCRYTMCSPPPPTHTHLYPHTHSSHTHKIRTQNSPSYSWCLYWLDGWQGADRWPCPAGRQGPKEWLPHSSTAKVCVCSHYTCGMPLPFANHVGWKCLSRHWPRYIVQCTCIWKLM